MHEMKTWTFSGSEVRTVEVNGEPWFVGKDVADVLGYQNASKALSDHVDDDDKLNNESLSSLGQRGGWLINESGVYALIFGSKLPNAKDFKHWVTSEVLPSIRKTGSYSLTDSYQIEDPIERAKRWIEEQQEKKQLQLTVSVQTQQIAELQPKASYYDVVLNCKDLLSITDIAKDYGKSGKWLNKHLYEKGVQFKQAGIWLLYQKYAEQGYTSTKTQPYAGSDGEVHSKVHTYWTQKGRLFIYELLKAEGILPIVERAA